MSRLGKRPIPLQDSVDAKIENEKLVIKGPKGELSLALCTEVSVDIQSDPKQIMVNNTMDPTIKNPKHGLYRSLVINLVEGVTTGYRKNLELQGVGYRVQLQGKKLVFQLGYSHPVEVEPSEGVQFEVDGQTKLSVIGIDKHQVGQVAANIRKLRQPDAYKGKGIRYEGEYVKLKAGKSVS